LGRIAETTVEFSRCSARLEPGDGTSWLGGSPALSADAAWPERDGQPLAFVAQVDLAEIASTGLRGLPTDGWLVFFYDAVDQPWGFDPKDAGLHRAVYVGGEAQRRELPDSVVPDARFTEHHLRASLELTLPAWDSDVIESLGLTEAEVNAYNALHEKLVGGDQIHRVLGWPDQVQGDMQLECQLVTNGLYAGDASGYDDPRAQELAAGASEWRLLFQLDSDDDIGMMWGDVGRLYWWIRASDLEARNFDATWLVLQCS
jgi:uncharacterized protein YwqG